ncbi:MAG: hypothetical protein GW754_03430 [Candidatus Pacebacteria bacterium]|nr:hypothetical protein [Candidatus Pacearchaeota archaeon]NCQ65863.1 hypothetical protein [Candidatus Paceibacterota bacterium]NCS86260.1 hypothetical protein [Candidatus Paceibacterota bacterium]
MKNPLFKLFVGLGCISLFATTVMKKFFCADGISCQGKAEVPYEGAECPACKAARAAFKNS